jgi:hypothetical protein
VSRRPVVNSQKCVTEKQTIFDNRMCIAARGEEEGGVYKVQSNTNKSVKTGKQFFDTKNYSKSTFI